MEVAGLGLVPQRLLAWVCSHRGCLLGFTRVEVAGSSLLPNKLLAWACSGGGHCLGLAFVEVADSSVKQRLPAWAWSHVGRSLGSASFILLKKIKTNVLHITEECGVVIS